MSVKDANESKWDFIILLVKKADVGMALLFVDADTWFCILMNHFEWNLLNFEWMNGFLNVLRLGLDKLMDYVSTDWFDVKMYECWWKVWHNLKISCFVTLKLILFNACHLFLYNGQKKLIKRSKQLKVIAKIFFEVDNFGFFFCEVCNLEQNLYKSCQWIFMLVSTHNGKSCVKIS